jgi:hypothetical protein
MLTHSTISSSSGVLSRVSKGSIVGRTSSPSGLWALYMFPYFCSIMAKSILEGLGGFPLCWQHHCFKIPQTPFKLFSRSRVSMLAAASSTSVFRSVHKLCQIAQFKQRSTSPFNKANCSAIICQVEIQEAHQGPAAVAMTHCAIERCWSSISLGDMFLLNTHKGSSYIHPFSCSGCLTRSIDLWSLS